MIYPATLIATSIIVVGIMMVWVVPKITAVFTSSNRELPLITRIIINISEFTQSYGLFLLLAVGLLYLGFSQAMRDPQRKRRWHEFMLTLPGLGRWIRIG